MTKEVYPSENSSLKNENHQYWKKVRRDKILIKLWDNPRYAADVFLITLNLHTW